MVNLVQVVGDRMLSTILPRGTARACIPNQPYYRCHKVTSNACWKLKPTPLQEYQYCQNNCAGVYTCTWTGDCCA
jgi:hypothetical protein